MIRRKAAKVQRFAKESREKLKEIRSMARELRESTRIKISEDSRRLVFLFKSVLESLQV